MRNDNCQLFLILIQLLLLEIKLVVNLSIENNTLKLRKHEFFTTY